MPVKATIRGLQEAQAACNRAAAAVAPRGALGRAVKYVTATVHRYAVAINPFDTGSWRAAQRQQLAGDARWGRVFLAPGAANSRTGTPVDRYAGMYEERGGRYAIYQSTVEEIGQKALDEGGQMIEDALP